MGHSGSSRALSPVAQQPTATAVPDAYCAARCATALMREQLSFTPHSTWHMFAPSRARAQVYCQRSQHNPGSSSSSSNTTNLALLWCHQLRYIWVAPATSHHCTRYGRRQQHHISGSSRATSAAPAVPHFHWQHLSRQRSAQTKAVYALQHDFCGAWHVSQREHETTIRGLQG
eukprot:scaffold51377_cov28-Tisochrysis_lutea.AAC.1